MLTLQHPPSRALTVELPLLEDNMRRCFRPALCVLPPFWLPAVLGGVGQVCFLRLLRQADPKFAAVLCPEAYEGTDCGLEVLAVCN